jgi:protein-S-isoprenylcysteine O-methyltransferase Ste14
MNSKFLSIIATVVSILALVTLILNHGLFSRLPVVIGVQTLAILLMIWARLTLGVRSFHAAANPTEGTLITGGPYNYIRNPIYTAVIIFTVAGVLANYSLQNSLLGLVILAGMVIRSLCEERLLRVQYPEYADYARRTWRMIPYVF